MTRVQLDLHISDLVKQLIDATFDTGYYQGQMEAGAATLSDQQLKEYAVLNQAAIGRREDLRKRISSAILST